MIKYDMTVIIPVFNESENLDRILNTFLDYFEQSRIKTKVLFVDDGSTDDSFKRIEQICNANPDFDYLKFKQHCGLSAAIKAGIDAIATPLIGYIDADLQTNPFDFDKLLVDIDKYSAVVGFRRHRQDPFFKRMQSKTANSIRRILINDGIIDTGCPLKIMHNNVAKKMPFFKGMHRFIPALIQLQGGKVKQIEVQHFKRLAGHSKFNLLNRSFRTLQDVFAYRWMRRRYINYSIEKTSFK